MKKITIIFITLLIILNLPATLLAAQKTITTYTWDRNIQVSAGGGNPFIPPGVPPDFPPIVNDPSTPVTSAIIIDPVTGAIVLGNGVNNGSGAIWYGGTSPVGTCNPCTSGVCPFGLGFRAYFEFKVTTPDSSSGSTDFGDGFNFTIVNASNNRISYRGGAPNAAVGMGELNGYAGSGNTAATSSSPHLEPPSLDGLGLQPPKMALEFDTYANTGAMNYNGCSGGRQDTANNHIALMFWGANTAPVLTTMCDANSTAGNTFPQASFDYNIHGAGTAGSTTVPRNSFTGDGTGGYYERAKGTSTYNWLEDDKYHRVRIEVIRIPSTFSYQMKAWVDCESCTATPCTACPVSPVNEYVFFQDVLNPYNNSSYLPKIDRTQQLDTTLNTLFNNILFGFTLGTGGATQSIQINNFAIYFPTSTVGTPSNLSFAASGGNGTVSVTAVTGCTWTTSNNGNTWITVIPASSTGTGSAQTVNYTVAANTGIARTGTMTIAGQTFTVTQAAGPPTCTLTAGTNIVPYGSTTTLTWTIANGPATTASWTTSPGGTCGSPNPAGGSCTTAAQTTAGARTYTLTVSNANGSSTCSTTFYVGCQNYQVWNGLGGTRDFYINGGCRDGIGSPNGQITQTGNRLDPGETIQAYSSTGTCTTALGIALDYNDAMNVDIVVNGGDGGCRVNFTGNHTATDRD